MLQVRALLALATLLVFSVSEATAADTSSSPYPLDEISRVLAPGEALPCAHGDLELITYRGERLRYQKPMRIHPAFRARLSAFEELVETLAREHYGRSPKQIVHLGSYNCRVMRTYPTWVSEHALGNALDVAGFDFGPLPRGASTPENLPRPLRRGFEVRLERHWNGTGVAAYHAAFLRKLADAIIARPDVFRVILGPAWPGHKNHFHLDFAPYRVVEVYEQ